MLKKCLVTLTVLLITALLFGCTDRNNDLVRGGIEVRDSNELNLKFAHTFSLYLNFSMFGDIARSPTLEAKVYFPVGYELDASDLVSLPTLYLLSPFRGNSGYYFNHGLVQIADKLIAAGEIVPMFIICIDGSHGFGATFYGESWAGGRYTSLIGERVGDPEDGSLIDYVDLFTLNTDTSRAMRAISGFGLGGYGAMRIAIEHSENFGSVTAVSAPLDFDGLNGTSGFESLFKTVADNIAIDSVVFEEMKPSLERPLRTMFMGGACSFSPHIDYENVDYDYTGEVWTYDQVIFDDLTTQISTEGISFHLPFDENGDIYDTVWNLWLNNNVPVLLDNNISALDSTAVKLYTVADDRFDFGQQTRDFAVKLKNHLQGRGITWDEPVVQYNGYEGYDATISHFVYDILPEILKYHSNIFEEAANTEE